MSCANWVRPRPLRPLPRPRPLVVVMVGVGGGGGGRSEDCKEMVSVSDEPSSPPVAEVDGGTVASEVSAVLKCRLQGRRADVMNGEELWDERRTLEVAGVVMAEDEEGVA